MKISFGKKLITDSIKLEGFTNKPIKGSIKPKLKNSTKKFNIEAIIKRKKYNFSLYPKTIL